MQAHTRAVIIKLFSQQEKSMKEHEVYELFCGARDKKEVH